MSGGRSFAELVVRAASRALPRSLRDRYREQWLADLRDAPELNLQRSQIARGALAFAVSLPRRILKKRELTAVDIRRRSRIASGLALSSALLGISQYASSAGADGLTENEALDVIVFSVSAFLAIYAVLAAVFAMILIGGTRGISSRHRWVVTLFVIASSSPLVQAALDRFSQPGWSPYVSPDSLAYAGGVVLVVVGIALGREPRTIARTMVSPDARVSILATVGVLVVAAATIGNAAVLWALRTPLKFGGTHSLSNPTYVQWLGLKEQGEAMVASIFAWWIGAAVVLAAVILISTIAGRLSPQRIVLLATGAVAVTLIASGGALGFLQLMEFEVVPLPEITLFLIVGRLLLAATILEDSRPRVLKLQQSRRQPA